VSRHLLLLNEIGRIVGEARTMQEILDRVVALVAERMETDVCTIWMLDAARTKLTLAAAEGLAPEAAGTAFLRKGQGLTWRVLEIMAPVIVEDAPSDPRFVYLPDLREEPYHAYLGTPLQVRGTPIGVLYVETRAPRRFDRDEVRALSAIASQIAPVLDNARLLSLVAGGERMPAMPQPRPGGPRRAQGTPCCGGVVSGAVVRLNSALPATDAPAMGGPVEEELEILRKACAAARAELLRMQEWLRKRNAEEAALVFSVQLMMLEDPAFEGRMREAVQQGLSARAAVRKVSQDLVERFATMKDLLFRQRSEDLQDLAGRLLRHVRSGAVGGKRSLSGKVAVLDRLRPSRLVSLCAEGVAAVLAGGGGATSHAALLARSLDLPLVVGLGDFVREIHAGQRVLVDAAAGEVVLDPPEEMVREVERAASAGAEALRAAFATGGEASGRIRFEANVSLWGDAVRAHEEEGDGIGLYRTEFAFLMRSDLPSEEEQYVLYRRVVERVAPKPVTFRLLDAGGDKLLPALSPAREPNPFLGYRSLRLLLDHPEILSAQARAILHALEGTEGRLLVPMVGCLAEFEAVRTLLRHEGMALPPLGAMVELPSALMELRELAEAADFLSVGTNDLTQHLLGVHRTNARVTRFFDVCHPAVVRAIRKTGEACEQAGKPLCICGEAASNPLLLPLWLGLGVRRLSVHASRLRVLRAIESRLDPAACRNLVEELQALRTGQSIRTRLERMAAPEVLAWTRVRRGR